MGEKDAEVDEWLADDRETYSTTIVGKIVIFKASPNGPIIDRLADRWKNDLDRANYELVKYLVISPEITSEYWSQLSAKVRFMIIQECLSICGMETGFRR